MMFRLTIITAFLVTLKVYAAGPGCNALFSDPDYFKRDPWERLRRSSQSEESQTRISQEQADSDAGDEELSNGGYGVAGRDSEEYFK
jgi:hypothetical protein